MKNKKIISVFLFIIILCITTTIQATTTSMLSLKITLPEDLARQIPQDANTQQYYAQNNIYLHASNAENNESFVIVQLENERTKKVNHLKELAKEDFEVLLEQYNKQKEQENQTKLKQEIYETEDMLFIDTVFEHIAEGKVIQSEEYYTIVQGKALIISANFLEKEVDFEKVRNIIDSISISKEETKEIQKDTIYLWAIVIIASILIVSYIIKEKKNKLDLEENEKETLLQKVKEYIEKSIQYDKFKGILILFVVTIVLNSISLAFAMVQSFMQYHTMIHACAITKIYVGLVILQNIVQLIGMMYITYILTKRKEETIKTIQKIFLGMLMIIAIITSIRLILQAITNGINQEFLTKSMLEVKVLAKSMLYILIWYCYFKNSIRVCIYYKQKSLEQIIAKPKKRISN